MFVVYEKNPASGQWQTLCAWRTATTAEAFAHSRRGASREGFEYKWERAYSFGQASLYEAWNQGYDQACIDEENGGPGDGNPYIPEAKV